MDGKDTGMKQERNVTIRAKQSLVCLMPHPGGAPAPKVIFSSAGQIPPQDTGDGEAAHNSRVPKIRVRWLERQQLACTCLQESSLQKWGQQQAPCRTLWAGHARASALGKGSWSWVLAPLVGAGSVWNLSCLHPASIQPL